MIYKTINNFSLSRKRVELNFTYPRKKNETSKYWTIYDDSKGHLNVWKKKAWDPHVHEVQEMVPHKEEEINTVKFDWLASTSSLDRCCQLCKKNDDSEFNNTSLER